MYCLELMHATRSSLLHGWACRQQAPRGVNFMCIQSRHFHLYCMRKQRTQQHKISDSADARATAKLQAPRVPSSRKSNHAVLRRRETVGLLLLGHSIWVTPSRVRTVTLTLSKSTAVKGILVTAVLLVRLDFDNVVKGLSRALHFTAQTG